MDGEHGVPGQRQVVGLEAPSAPSVSFCGGNNARPLVSEERRCVDSQILQSMIRIPQPRAYGSPIADGSSSSQSTAE